jgi:ssDNA-binding Zn-finger/Zn-ribbon topoisomerase 1
MDIQDLNEIGNEPLVGSSVFQEGDECPTCSHYGRKGYLIKRESIYGEFVGCSNFPRCNFKHNL